MPSDGTMKGKRALVTGAGRGIGRAIALALAAEGAAVSATARTRAGIEAVAGEITDSGGRAVPIVADLADPSAPARIVEETVATLGGVDVLVNNAGTMAPWKRAESVTGEHWDTLLRVNLQAPFFLAQAALPHLAASKGCIVNIASIAGLEATERMLPYSVTKAGLVQLTKDLAYEWAGKGIRVNAIAPGWVETDMTAGVRGNAAIHESIRKTVPLGRFATPDEIAGLAVWLASPAAAYVTGAVFVADGGESI